MSPFKTAGLAGAVGVGDCSELVSTEALVARAAPAPPPLGLAPVITTVGSDGNAGVVTKTGDGAGAGARAEHAIRASPICRSSSALMERTTPEPGVWICKSDNRTDS